MIDRKTGVLLAATAILLPTLALASATIGDKVGVTDAEITAALAAKGYEVTEIEREHDEIEISATIDGSQVEIEVSPETGLVTELELDDDDDDDDKD